ncbi:MAG: TlpA disulfide reductase family protein [Xanthomonadales bacterium]|nr:TlpA disulfide reductase family protein [Xanthomonadales bacterium]
MQRRTMLLMLICLAAPVAVRAADAPSFTLPELETGRMLSLEDFQGQVVYVDFWASWCGPCRKSLPLYEEMRQQLEAKAFSIVAINLDEKRADAEQFLARHPVGYTVLLDPAGESAAAWQIKAMPSSFLLDTENRIVRSWAGFTTDHLEEIRSEILALVD